VPLVAVTGGKGAALQCCHGIQGARISRVRAQLARESGADPLSHMCVWFGTLGVIT
jgi:hypothetical protein